MTPVKARKNIDLYCLDVDGTLMHGIGGEPIAGAVDVVRQLRKRAKVRFVTNAGIVPRADIAHSLRQAGFLDHDSELYTPATVARRALAERGHDHGTLLVSDEARCDWSWFRDDPSGGAIVLATEGWHLSLEDLQPLFRALLEGAPFYVLNRNRYFRVEHELKTDLGPLAEFLGYASRREPEVLGKPSRLLFETIASEVGVALGNIAMIGDDAEFDASGAVRLGLQGMLVKTGKYRVGDESRVDPRPVAVLEQLAQMLDG